MTDEKICPIMSRPIMMFRQLGKDEVVYRDPIFGKVCCQKEKCMAWVPECHWFDEKEPLKCDPSDCSEEGREYGECRGGCRLI